MPLVRWPSRGLSEDEPRAFMFTNVIDVKGRKYDIQRLSDLWRRAENLRLLIDATRNGTIRRCLPKREYMERAKQLWERLELPRLKPQDPWVRL